MQRRKDTEQSIWPGIHSFYEVSTFWTLSDRKRFFSAPLRFISSLDSGLIWQTSKWQPALIRRYLPVSSIDGSVEPPGEADAGDEGGEPHPAAPCRDLRPGVGAG